MTPNYFPSNPTARRIALIGESPGADEERLGRPFVGYSGKFLGQLLARAGVSIDSCFLGNISQHRPPDNKFELFKWDGDEIQSGMAQLRKDLDVFKPNIVVLLGNPAFKAAMEPLNGGKAKFKKDEWRGTLFRCATTYGPFTGLKCIASHHPAYVLRDYAVSPLLQFDLKRAVEHSLSPELNLPHREIYIAKDIQQVKFWLNEMLCENLPVSIDIEGYPWKMSCIGFSNHPDHAFVVPILRRDWTHYWNDADEQAVYRYIASFLESLVPKVGMNLFYDQFVLQFCYGICTRNVVGDIMLSHWELYADLAGEDKDKKRRKSKSLALQTSIYTLEPFYKDEGDSTDDETFYKYNGKDCCTTLEIWQKHHQWIEVEPSTEALSNYQLSRQEWELRKAHLAFNMAIRNPLLYMMNRGVRYNADEAAKRREALRTQMFAVQARFNALTGHRLSWTSHKEINNWIAEVMLTKKGDRPYKEYEQSYARLQTLLSEPKPCLSHIGEIETLLDVGLNVESPKEFSRYLYTTLQLPTQYNDDKENPRPTTDYEALLKLSRICLQQEKKFEHQIIQAAIELRALTTRQEMLSINTDNDNRIRCSYNPVGSSTGRITSRESVTGSGYNLQTIPNYTSATEAPGGILGDRDLFVADDSKWFFQCDLSGADGWTVAAYSAMLGDSTMLDDYKAGITPFKILTLKMRGLPTSADRKELAQQVKVIEKDAWDRFACKRIQHGSSYMEGGLTISRSILKDSEGKLYMSPTECEQLKGFFFQRYWGVSRWHDWVARRIKERPVLVAASGQVRQFFGRPDEILTKAIAFEPQCNTTWVANLALLKLWTDNDNRTTDRGLLIEPLLHIHDAIAGQFYKDKASWAVPRIRSYFNNPVKIAGQDITIPFEGNFGCSWGNLEEGVI